MSKVKKHELGMLEKVLLSPGLEIAIVLCDSHVSHDRWQVAADPLSRVFLSHGGAFHLIRHFITEDVAAVSGAESLFRTNTPATRMMSSLYRAIGAEYLKPLLFPAVTEVLSTERDWEGEGEERAMELCKQTLMRVFDSAQKCPKILRLLFRHVRDTAGKRFPQSRLVSVGSFFFLRFLVPALASPNTFGVTDEPVRPKAKKGLVLISTAVQKLANGVLSNPTAERLPAGALELGEKLFPQLLDFLERLCDLPQEDLSLFNQEQQPQQNPTPPNQKWIGYCEEAAFNIDEDLTVIHDCIVKSFQDISDALTKRFPNYNKQQLRDIIIQGQLQQAKKQPPTSQLSQQLQTIQQTTTTSPPSPLSTSSKQKTNNVNATEANAAHGIQTEFVGDIRREIKRSIEDITTKTEQLYESMALRLENEMNQRRKAEEECRQLRAELDLLHRRFAVDTNAVMPLILESPLSLPVPSNSPMSNSANGITTPSNDGNFNNLTVNQRLTEMARKKELFASIGEIHTVLDELRIRVNDPSDINDAIFVGKVVRELHMLVQMPLGKQPEMKQIPKQYDTSAITWEKTKPLRTATTKALDEIKAHLDVVFAELGPLLHLVDLEQRIHDTRAIIKQTTKEKTQK